MDHLNQFHSTVSSTEQVALLLLGCLTANDNGICNAVSNRGSGLDIDACFNTCLSTEGGYRGLGIMQIIHININTRT